MSLSRRQFLGQAAATAAATGALTLPQLWTPALAQAIPSEGGPRTGFEQTGTWSTRQEEEALLEEVAATTPNAELFELSVIGQTFVDQTDMFMVTFGPKAEAPGAIPTVVIACSQHGNEPAGRDAGLRLIRDLAFTTDEAILDLLGRTRLLVVPSMNPEGRQRNDRENALGIDINRDHLSLVTNEAQALARVTNAHRPFMVVDHHEYGPSVPVLYDDDVLYLWPRNRNTDLAVQDNARNFCLRYIKADCEAAGFTADEYGLYRVGPNVGPVATPLTSTGLQMAGDGDDGIARNAAGLRNTMGILVESRVTLNPFQGPEELVYDGDGGSLYGDSVAARARRVQSQYVVMEATLRYLREQGEAAMLITDSAGLRKAEEGARGGTVYFDGQDDESNLQADTTSSTDSGITGYQLTPEQLATGHGAFANNANPSSDGTLSGTLGLHEVEVDADGFVSMAQERKNVIPLLLDGRALRHAISADPSR